MKATHPIVIVTVIFAAASICDAAVVTNAFAVVEGSGIRVAGDNLFHYSATGQNKPIKVSTRPGWRFRSGKRTEALMLRSGSYEHEVVSDLGEDGEEVRIEPCTIAENKEDEHMSDPKVSLSILSKPGVVLYVAPKTEVEVSAAVMKVVGRKGIHRKRVTYQPCPVCGNVKPDTDWEYYEKTLDIDTWLAAGPGYTANSSTWRHAVSSGANQEVAFNLTSRCSDCGDCTADADKTVQFNVAKVHVERQNYIGMDRSDVGRSVPVFRTASVLVQPSIGTATYSWTGCGICSFEGNTDNATSCYKLSDPNAASSGFLAEPLAVTVECQSDDGSASVTCVTNFTVVKLDVEIDGISEDIEETQGAILAYMKDSFFGALTDEGKNNLVPVKITCRPIDLPQSEMVDIVAPGGFLYVRVNGEYQPAQSSYKACEISDKNFFLHGHSVSSSIGNYSIEVSHAASGARDVAKFTVYKYSFIAYVDQPVAGQRVVFQGTPPDIEVGHAFWELQYQGPSMENPTTALFFQTYQNFINNPMGFYPVVSPPPLNNNTAGRLAIPDTAHSYDVTHGWEVSLASFCNAVDFSSDFGLRCSLGSIQYNLTHYNCVNATVEAGAGAQLSLPQTLRVWPYDLGVGLNPGDFGEDLRLIPIW